MPEPWSAAALGVEKSFQDRGSTVDAQGVASSRVRPGPLPARRPKVALHRWVQLLGILLVALIITVAAVGLGALRVQHHQTSEMVARSAARELIGLARTDIDRSQVQLEALLPRQATAAGQAALPAAIVLQQQGLDDWVRYQRDIRRYGPLPAGTDQLDRALDGLQIADRLPTAARASAAAWASRLAAETAADQRVTIGFDAVRTGEQAWWTASLSHQRATIRRAEELLASVVVVALLLTVVANGLFARAVRRRDLDLAARDADLTRVAVANEFEARLQRALELSTTETRVFEVVEQALDEAVPDLGVEMLLADSSRAHLEQLVSVGPPTHRCSVESPGECPAAQRGEVLIFESSHALDACPYLRGGATPCSALCVPVSVSGLTVGIVHAAGRHGEPPDRVRRGALELVSRRASDRIGMMRAFSRSEVQANIDPLTGLPNRRSLEERVHRLGLADTRYALAFGDLDHFKRINDVYGHGAGDQALRVFAQILRDGLRPGDLPGRYGGEEFVVVLPDCSEDEAVRVLERIREQLIVRLLDSGSPSFTISFGLAFSPSGQRFEEMVKLADEALLKAKALGRNRVVVAGRAEILSAVVEG